MNTNAMRQSLHLLLGLVCLMACAQQSTQPSVVDASQQVSANQSTSNAPLKTADGALACPLDSKSKSLPDGVYGVGGGVLPPTPIETPEAAVSDEALKFIKKQHIKWFQASSILSLIVDTNGMPQDICVAKEAGHSLDRNAVEAVKKYRFKPATLDGKPVPVHLSIAVSFNLY
jgi:TonB family protein